MNTTIPSSSFYNVPNFFDPLEVEMRKIGNRKGRKKLRKFNFKENQITTINYTLKPIQPKTDNQKKVFDSYSNKHVCLTGFAGTGKTFISIYLALKDILHNHKYEKLIIVRSIVETRKIGFLPGSALEKCKEYEAPYYGIFQELFGRDCYETFKNKGTVEFVPTSFLRGQTFNNSIILVDECQNQDYHELSTVLTRVGDNVKLVLCGDIKQNDLRNTKEKSGLSDILNIMQRMKSMEVVDFKKDDIVRSDFVKEFLISEDMYFNGSTP